MAAPVITPGGPLTKDGGSTTDFTANQNVTWTATRGALSLVTVNSVRWSAPNETGTWLLRATNAGTEFDEVSITVRAVIPNYWSWQTPITAKKDVQVFRPIYGPTQWRGFGEGEFIHEWELGGESFQERFEELKAFWLFHYGTGLPFDLIDPILEERRTYEADSDLSYQYKTNGQVAWRCRIKEAYPYVATPA